MNLAFVLKIQFKRNVPYSLYLFLFFVSRDSTRMQIVEHGSVGHIQNVVSRLLNFSQQIKSNFYIPNIIMNRTSLLCSFWFIFLFTFIHIVICNSIWTDFVKKKWFPFWRTGSPFSFSASIDTSKYIYQLLCIYFDSHYDEIELKLIEHKTHPFASTD